MQCLPVLLAEPREGASEHLHITVIHPVLFGFFLSIYAAAGGPAVTSCLPPFGASDWQLAAVSLLFSRGSKQPTCGAALRGKHLPMEAVKKDE